MMIRLMISLALMSAAVSCSAGAVADLKSAKDVSAPYDTPFAFPDMSPVSFVKDKAVNEPQVIKTASSPGKYRMFNPASQPKPWAVMFGVSDDYKTRERLMTMDDIMVAELATIAQLTKLGIQVLLPANDGPSYAAIENALRRAGANMTLVKRIDKHSDFRNHPWMRDWGPLPLRHMETGQWGIVLMQPEPGLYGRKELPTGFMGEWLEKNTGMPVLGSYYVESNALMGGNMLGDEEGRCISAGTRHPLFGGLINCTTIVTMPCRSPVCHADEYFVMLKGGAIASTKPEFDQALREAGFTKILHLPDDKDLSFTNVLMAGDYVFMMYVKDLKGKMLQAKAVYEEAGYTVFPIKTNGCGESFGALHCLSREIPFMVVPAR